jgi:aspartate kinase
LAFKTLSVGKFGGSLLDVEGKGIPRIIQQIKEIKSKDAVGPIAVFSAPTGCTDALIKIGESYSQECGLPVEPIFEIYERLAKLYVKGELLNQALKDIATYKALTTKTLQSVNKRFSGNAKARTLTYGGEICMANLMKYILQSSGIDACTIPIQDWPVVTDDNFEDAATNYNQSRKRLNALATPLEEGKVICMAGFFGVTPDGLETILGRGGSDLTAVFASCLLNDAYQTKTLLYKDVNTERRPQSR